MNARKIVDLLSGTMSSLQEKIESIKHKNAPLQLLFNPEEINEIDSIIKNAAAETDTIISDGPDAFTKDYFIDSLIDVCEAATRGHNMPIANIQCFKINESNAKYILNKKEREVMDYLWNNRIKELYFNDIAVQFTLFSKDLLIFTLNSLIEKSYLKISPHATLEGERHYTILKHQPDYDIYDDNNLETYDDSGELHVMCLSLCSDYLSREQKERIEDLLDVPGSDN